MNQTYRLFIPALLLITMLIGSVSAFCPEIPDPPYVPKSPQEDIVKVTTWVDGSILGVIVEFAAATPPPGETLHILITTTQVTPPTETVVTCNSFTNPSGAFVFNINLWTQDTPSIAVYAWLSSSTTDRAPNDGYYLVTGLSRTPNLFTDIEPAPVGGVATSVNKLMILTPYLVLAGLIAVISTIFVIKKRK
ncbi:hypothetical protein [[Eubacterium] cellulosolvens]